APFQKGDILSGAAGGGMGVGGGDEDIAPGNPGGFLDAGADRFGEFVGDADDVSDDEGHLRFAVVEHDAAGEQVVVDRLGGVGGEASDDGETERRGDIAGGGADPELSFLGENE